MENLRKQAERRRALQRGLELREERGQEHEQVRDHLLEHGLLLPDAACRKCPDETEERVAR